MKLIEILKAQGFTDEQISKIQASMKENKIYETSLENADEEYSKLKTEKEDLDEQLNTANTTIKDLKKNNKDNEDLQQTIKDHEATIETLKNDSASKIKKLTLDNAINSRLSKVDDKYKTLLEGQFDREKLTIKEDGTVEGLDEQVKTLSETYSEWFEDATPSNTGGLGNFNRNPSGGGETQSLGERLAKQAIESNTNNYDYFGGAK
ncbi:phage scaffolding protein [Romboutsia lituseburensis]|uniref:Phage minor structural protein GP20 n=1 Tax=Romboutsia lituseburensis DSM 797 TaxID=1121325 RepID=A0A1G9U0G4_9FIRM|nr:phage scaffolding protein [Romboutsia lituseburensis]CEH34722.1 Phage minor structural GP20 [Romboutsia lituseburensis]SDM53144.1 Phage minor structural protein GP20 [Romboutsia lituseburensis DSM 797]